MKKFGRSLAALSLVSALALSSSFSLAAEETTSPAEGSSTGTGKVEGIVNMDVFVVDLPTIDENSDTTFDFILDPQGLIAATGEAAYTDKTFEEDATLFFANTGGTTDYSSTSDSLVAKNKGTTDVDVTLTATPTTDFSFGTDKAFTDDTTSELYLELSDGTNTKALTSEGATIETTLDKVGDDAYKVTYDDSGYSYELDTDYNDFDSISFNLSGAANPNADWTDKENVESSVAVAWTLKEHEKNVAPTTSYDITYDSTTYSTIKLNLGAGTLAATDVAVAYAPSGATWTKAASIDAVKTSKTWFFDTATSTLYIGPGYAASAGQTSTLKLNDTAETIVTINYK